jgi:transcription initiation factor TFIIIB Brf1 subunit/transcription initiation factor TFIIB
MMRMKVFKNVELDMDASGATDDDLVDHHNDTKKKIIICPCCGVLFDPKTKELQVITFSRRYKRSNRTVYDGGSNTTEQKKGKKLDAVIDGKKTVSFGQKNAFSDFTLHKD